MASSFLSLRLVIPIEESTEQTVAGRKDVGWPDSGRWAGGSKRLIRAAPVRLVRSPLGWWTQVRNLGCVWVADLAGLVRNVPMEVVDLL